MIGMYPTAISRSGYFKTASESIGFVPVQYFTGYVPDDTLHSFFDILCEKRGSSAARKVTLYLEFLLQSKCSNRIWVAVKVISD
jgi:hypothetical protein